MIRTAFVALAAILATATPASAAQSTTVEHHTAYMLGNDYDSARGGCRVQKMEIAARVTCRYGRHKNLKWAARLPKGAYNVEGAVFGRGAAWTRAYRDGEMIHAEVNVRAPQTYKVTKILVTWDQKVPA